MKIMSSTALRKDYNAVSSLAHESNEPIFITMNGDGDTVLMSIHAFEERERELDLRSSVLEAEFGRLLGEETYSLKEVRAKLKEKYSNG